MICRRASSSLISRFLVSSRLSNSIPSCNFVDKIDSEILSYSNEVAPVPSGLPFKLYAPLGKEKVLMQQRHRNEDIKVHAWDRLKYQVNGDPFISLYVRVVKRRFKVMSHMTAKPGQINIHDVTVRNMDGEYCSDEFVEYLTSKGITSKTISVLCDHFGNKLKNAPATPENSSLEVDGLPFDYIGEDQGAVILVKETKDEIVKVQVEDANDFGYHGEEPDDWIWGCDYLYGHNDFGDYEEYDDDVVCGDGGSDDKGNQMENEEDGDPNKVPWLKMFVFIHYGDDFNRFLQFEGLVSPNEIRFDEIHISSIARGVSAQERHLDEFEEFYKKRGIESCNFDFLFDLMDKRDQMIKDFGRIPGGRFVDNPF